MRITDKEKNVVFGRQQFYQIETSTAVDEEENVAVVLVVVECPLQALDSQHWHEGEDDLLVAEQQLKDF